MHECDLLSGRLEQHEAVVLDRHVPEIRMREAADFDKFAKKPARQINQVDSLIDQFPASGALWLSTPLTIITGPAAVSVARTDEKQGPQYSRIDQASRLLERAFIAVIESHAHPHIVFGSEFREIPQLIGIS